MSLASLPLVVALSACEQPVLPAASFEIMATASSTNRSVEVSPESATLNAIGASLQLSATVTNRNGKGTGQPVAWSSLDPSIATVDDTGLVISHSIGVAQILATSGGAVDTSVVTVQQVIASIAVTPASASIVVGDSVLLDATAADSNGVAVQGASFTWESSNAAIAHVDERGVVRGTEAGAALITATIDDPDAEILAGTAPVDVTIPPPPSSAPRAATLWIDAEELAARPTSGAAWNNVKAQADATCGPPDLSNQDDKTDVCILAKALVYARIGGDYYRDEVRSAIQSIVDSGPYSGRALALGRNLIAYPISADLVDLKSLDPALDAAFRVKLVELRTTFTMDGPDNLIDCHEKRPNNWGTHCGASRAAVAAYLEDKIELERTAQVFKGWLGDRASYAGFKYGDRSWQCDPDRPVGINPKGCTNSGHNFDGILPDDQRRGGSFDPDIWPPPHENYVWEALQGALAQAIILSRQGYDVWNWEDQALLRAMLWLHEEDNYPAEGDDTWQPHVVNYFYGTSFPAPIPSQAGKNVGWTDWTHCCRQ